MRRTRRMLTGGAGLGSLLVVVAATALMCRAGEVPVDEGAATGTDGSPSVMYSQAGDAFTLEQAIVDAAESASRSVVAIEVQVPLETAMAGMPFGNPFEEMPDPFFFFDPDRFGPSGPDEETGEEAPERLIAHGGSGVIQSAEGHIVTNHHVIEDAREIRVILHDGQTFEAQVVGSDAESDLAVIKIDAEGLTPASFADMDAVKPGQFAIAVGMPLGLDYSVTVGHVSALGRGNLYPGSPLMQMQQQATSRLSIQNFIQTDASINPGNSGGPLVNLTGEVMGINTIVQGGVGGGFGFAIPCDMVQRVADQLVTNGVVSRAWLGISMTDLTYEKAQALEVGRNNGALVEQVFDDSPAAQAGIRRGDVIVAVDGDEVLDSKDVVYRVAGHLAGDELHVTFVRNGKEKTKQVSTGERADGLSRASGLSLEDVEEEAEEEGSTAGQYGMLLAPLTEERNRQLDRDAGAPGVLVSQVVPSGPAHRAGIRAGDVLIDVDGAPVSRPEKVVRALEKANKEYVPITVERDGRQRFVALKRISTE